MLRVELLDVSIKDRTKFLVVLLENNENKQTQKLLPNRYIKVQKTWIVRCQRCVKGYEHFPQMMLYLLLT
jgi:hypothetical protein